jgi:head-tail adaptor
MIPTLGQMRMILQFNRPEKDPDNTGGFLETYEEWFVTRGFIQFERGFRDFETGLDQHIKTYKAWIPWRNEFEANVTKDIRIIFEARDFAIDSWRLVGENRKTYELQLRERR